MATLNSVGKEITDSKKPKTLRDLIQSATKELGKALPAHLSADRLVRIAQTEIRKNPELAKCTPESFLGAMFTAAQMGLEPVAGRAYILPFNNKRKVNGEWKTVKEAQFLCGYKGLADLFYRHERAVALTWGVVKEGDKFDFQLGTEAKLIHKPGLKRGATLSYWVMAELKGGGKIFEVMSLEDCMAHGRKHSKTWITKVWDKKIRRMVDCEPHFSPSSPWAKSPESMCLKTVLIQLSKLIPMSIELQKAIAADESSRDYRAGVGDAIDITNSTTNWDESPESEKTPETGEDTQEPGNVQNGATGAKKKASQAKKADHVDGWDD